MPPRVREPCSSPRNSPAPPPAPRRSLRKSPPASHLASCAGRDRQPHVQCVSPSALGRPGRSTAPSPVGASRQARLPHLPYLPVPLVAGRRSPLPRAGWMSVWCSYSSSRPASTHTQAHVAAEPITLEASRHAAGSLACTRLAVRCPFVGKVTPPLRRPRAPLDTPTWPGSRDGGPPGRAARRNRIVHERNGPEA